MSGVPSKSPVGTLGAVAPPLPPEPPEGSEAANHLRALRAAKKKHTAIMKEWDAASAVGKRKLNCILMYNWGLSIRIENTSEMGANHRSSVHIETCDLCICKSNPIVLEL